MLEYQFILSVAIFAVAMTGTPGPNNMMLTASGANFGYWRSLPHIVGIGLGVVVLILLMSAGLGAVFQKFPIVQEVLKWISSAYLLFLAWKIGSAPAPEQHDARVARPMTLIQAATFQFVNPKAWAMAITAIGSFTLGGDQYWLSALMIALVFWVVGFPCISLWTGFGTLIGKAIRSPGQWRVFNGVMGFATASCLLFIWT
ncbi:LysE family translocator [Endozoicomonas ascidiicola]|uniref:LysE family translocator n=1 Tax=Endozoicomonas ascidiicola TaxID=1698521 RepID=UPI00083513A6|nr:LysE family translocator [Endozoicomonas ascidiicola]